MHVSAWQVQQQHPCGAVSCGQLAGVASSQLPLRQEQHMLLVGCTVSEQNSSTGHQIVSSGPLHMIHHWRSTSSATYYCMSILSRSLHLTRW